MPITLSPAEQFAFMRGLALNVNPKHGTFKGLPSSQVFNTKGIELRKWRGWSDRIPGQQAVDFYAQFQGLTVYTPAPPQVPGGVTFEPNNDVLGTVSLTQTVPGINIFLFIHNLGSSGFAPLAGNKIKIYNAVNSQFNGIYTVVTSIFSSPYQNTTLTRDDGNVDGFSGLSEGVGVFGTFSNNETYSIGNTSSVTYQNNLVFKEGNFDKTFSTLSGTPGNWLAIAGSVSNPNGTISQNLVDPTYGLYFSISTVAGQYNSKVDIKDFDPRSMPNDIGGAPRFKIGERKLHFKATVQIEARSAEQAYHVGFWRTHTFPAVPIEYQKGENCVCFYNNGSSTWIARVNKRIAPTTAGVINTHNFVTSATVEDVNTLEIKVDAEGKEAEFIINGVTVYRAIGNLPVMEQDLVQPDVGQVGVFAGASVRDVVPSNGSLSAGTLRIYNMILFSQKILQTAGLKLLKKLK